MIKELFSDESGLMSSARVFKFSAFFVATALAVVGVFVGKETQGYISQMVTMFLTLGGVGNVASQTKSAYVKAKIHEEKKGNGKD